MNGFTVVSTFSGCGGSSLGYKMAGGKILLAVEWDDNAVQTYRANFPDTPIHHGDIAKLSVDEVLQRTGLKPGELDIFDGSPPCQGFSTAGRRSFNDDRNQLFREYCRLLEGLQPKVFVMENVSGMVKGKMKIAFAEILKTLKACGYQVTARLLNAKNYGVPQSRERMIFIGTRSDLGIVPQHPPGRAQAITALKALSNICNTDEDEAEAAIKPTWQMYRVLNGKERHKHFGLVIVDPNRPSPTIVKDAGNTSTGIIHWSRQRKLTIPEIKRLASFPDSFRFFGSYKEKWARIGNCVPPLFMKAIAEHIRSHILIHTAPTGISLSSARSTENRFSVR